MFKLLTPIPIIKLPGGRKAVAPKGVCCEAYLADIALALLSDMPLIAQVVNICFNVREEFDKTFGVANFHSQQLIRLIHQLHLCEGRRAQVDGVFRITELLNAVDLLNKRWPIAEPSSRAAVFRPSIF